MPAAFQLVLLDSVAAVAPEHAGSAIITGSHGGLSAAAYAAQVPARLYVFNDAGVGKGEAGVAGLALLDAQGQAAVAVAHTSARIGEAGDTLACGVISRVNRAAAALGLRVGEPLRPTLARLGADPG
ncbi:MAG: hypothetical protein ACK5TK_13140 [Betaproteobacteria bacterium]